MKANRNTMLACFADAEAKGYAIPHFNFSDCWDLMAILEAADEAGSPVMLATVAKVYESLGPDLIVGMFDALASKVNVPAALHLDHSIRPETCLEALVAGYSSVMFDGSRQPLRENIDGLNRVKAAAHAANVLLEGEIGQIAGASETTDAFEKEGLAEVDVTAALVKMARPDLLAVAVGTQHGFYKGTPNIRFERLQALHEAVDVPLVLHGGTGIPAGDVRRAIRCGIRKMNVGTIIRYTYLTRTKEEVERQGASVYPAVIQEAVRGSIKQVIREWIDICGSAGRA